MKKTKYLLAFVSALVLMLVSAFSATAATTKYTSGVFTYTVKNGEAVVTGCDTSVEGHLVIPESLDGYPVTAIKEKAFYDCKEITDATIPQSIKYIGSYAFAIELERVYVDSFDFWYNITFDGAFSNPMHLAEEFYVGGSLLTDIVIPEGITTLPNSFFFGCYSLKSITFPKDFVELEVTSRFSCDVKEIYVPDLKVWFNICGNVREMFSSGKTVETIYINNEPVVDLVIPEDIDEIADYAFLNYKKLRSISFTKPIKRLGDSWNSGCDNFKAVYVDSFETWNNSEIKTDLGQIILGKVDYLYIDGEAVVDLVIPEGTTRINDYVFYRYDALRSVTIPESVEYIGSYALHSFNLENVYVESLEYWFKLCGAMNEVSISPDWHPMQYAENFYISGELLTNLIIPENVTEIPAYTFYNVSSIKSVTFYSDDLKIGSGAFRFACNTIESIYVSDIDVWFGLGSRIKSMFTTKKLKNLYIDGELLTEYTFPDGVIEIPEYAFFNYSGLKQVTFPSSVKSIGKNAFSGCVGLNRVTVPSSLQSIGENAFAGCINIESIYAPSLECWLNMDFSTADSNPLCPKSKLYLDGKFLETLQVPESIGTIKKYAFNGYYNLKLFVVTGSPLEIGVNAFAPNSSNLKINAETLEDWFSVKFDSNRCNPMRYGATLYIGGKQPVEIVIPESIKKIPNYAFHNCKSLKKITVPVTTSIGSNAFDGSGLKEVLIGSLTKKSEPVAVINAGMFEGCNALEKITFGYGVKIIGYRAFYELSKLNEIVFYSGLEEICKEAFRETGITSVVIPSTVKSIDEWAFAYCKSLTELTVGDAVGQETVMEIYDYAFSNCTKLNKVTFNSGIKKVWPYVFKNSYNIADFYVNDLPSYLEIDFIPYYGGQGTNPGYYAENMYINDELVKNLVIPEGTTRICNYAFSSCKSLETVKFPSTLVKIGVGAFSSCVNLKNFELPESIEIIEESAFSYCKSLTNVELKANLRKLGFEAFGDCTGVKTVHMYPRQYEIGKQAFFNCPNIEIIFYTGTEENWINLLDQNKNTGLENIIVYYEYHPDSMKPPEKIEAVQVSSDSITLSWSKVNGATGYRVYVKNNNKWKSLKTLKSNTFKVTGLTGGTKYSFAVKTYISKGAFVLWSPEYATYDARTSLGTPVISSTSKATDAIRLNWGKVTGASGYTVYQYKSGAWKRIATITKPDTVTYRVEKLKAGTTYKFRVKAYKKSNGETLWSAATPTTTVATRPLTPVIKSTSKATDAIRLNWGKVTGASGYAVYQYKSGAWKRIATITKPDTVTYRVEKLKAGTTYKFRVKAYKKSNGETLWSAATSTVTVTTKPATPCVTKISSTAKGSVTLVWSDVSGETGYEVYYSSKKDSGYKKVASYKTNVVKGSKSKLTSKKTYYFKVRAYTKTESGTVYSAWSSVKSVKVK